MKVTPQQAMAIAALVNKDGVHPAQPLTISETNLGADTPAARRRTQLHGEGAGTIAVDLVQAKGPRKRTYLVGTLGSATEMTSGGFKAVELDLTNPTGRSSK